MDPLAEIQETIVLADRVIEHIAGGQSAAAFRAAHIVRDRLIALEAEAAAPVVNVIVPPVPAEPAAPPVPAEPLIPDPASPPVPADPPAPPASVA